ncbi:MAG: hypothetical protein HC769_03590 [Cyanobacteria bacterium CRU_2_1]|nr:hypothetical protein [Cyanobacteria bacterium RU_5_0]NJR58007.1 hypothetical protein [Cyanobacteria bacterium CRU_2_1]
MTSATIQNTKLKNMTTVQKSNVGRSPLQLAPKTYKSRELIAQWLIVDGKLVCQWNTVEH